MAAAKKKATLRTNKPSVVRTEPDALKSNAHTVTMTTNAEWVLQKLQRGMQFEVRDASEKLGDLFVSRGGLRWKPASAQKALTLPWPLFAKEFTKRHGDSLAQQKKRAAKA